MITAIPSNCHFISVNELAELGLSYYKINRLVKAGQLVKVNKSMYENTNFAGDETDFSIVSAFAPKGVFCMMSAARYHGLTTFLLDAVDVAIERTMKISTLPDWPNVNIWYFSEKRYSKGISEASDIGGTFRIYDIEKTVVDILYYRNKVGIEETKEIIKNYLQREDRNLIQLRRYADELGCKKILETYLEVLL
ncbi:MAG: type IV toxin-antitoxin system AbiEi family antitoxin domain-containing protein [Eubacterium sp.]|nr:type IV toxin-antitoxin system AbiEi family antitoxin domain-containing protein [Eubacterium sp.]